MKLKDLKIGIRYVEKGIYLHEEIVRQGYTLIRVDGKWLCDDVEEVQKIIDTFDPLAGAKKAKIVALKELEKEIELVTAEGLAAKAEIMALEDVADVEAFDVVEAMESNNV